MSEVYDYWSKEDWIKHVDELEEERDSYEQQLKDADEEIRQLKERCEIASTQRRLYEAKAEERRDMLEDVINVLDLSDEAVATHGQQGTAPATLVRLALDERDRALDNDYKTRKIQQLETQLSGRTHHHDNPRIEEENEKLTAQVAVLLEAIRSETKHHKIPVTVDGGIAYQPCDCKMCKALSKTSDKADKLMAVVRAAEVCYYEGYDDMDAEYLRRMMVAVKAWKGE